MSTTLEKVNLSKQDFVLTKMLFSKVSEFDRQSQGKANLLFVTFVGSRSFAPTPSFLYFGKQSFEELQQLKETGTMVDVVLDPSDKGFTVTGVYATTDFSK